jgi:choline dehydrogenase
MGFDFIIVGAGASGCALARRLSENPDTSVLLVEAGDAVRWWQYNIHIPAAKGAALGGQPYDWAYITEPQAELGERRIVWHQGKALGGSSAINGMIFVRGNRADFDDWARDPELADWRYDAVLPYFRRLERHAAGASDYRGADGPLHVRRAEGSSPLASVFIEAGVQAGYPVNEDFNGPEQEGVGHYDMTVRHGRRVTTWDAYVRPVLNRRNLSVLTGAHAVRLMFRGHRCTGIVVESNGRLSELRAEREAIVAAGAIGSPALLLRSGIGPADDLLEAGVEPRVNLPGVGANLHDHLQVAAVYASRGVTTLNALTDRWLQYLTGLRWLLTRTGWGASNHFEVGGFVRSSPEVGWPDIQLHFIPHALSRTEAGELVGVTGFQLQAGPQRPRARGRLRLRSADHRAPPIIDPAYLTHPDDWKDMRRALELARELVSQPAFAPFREAEVGPGPNLRNRGDLDDYIRRTAGTGYHPCGTCRMGSGVEAVVDGQLRVYGVEGLRVVDSSVIPAITTGNLSAPTIMLAEKAADLIRGAPSAPAEPDHVSRWDHSSGQLPGSYPKSSKSRA